MNRNPYITAITAQLDIDFDHLYTFVDAHGTDHPIGRCADQLQKAIMNAEAAEWDASAATRSLCENAEAQARNLTGAADTFDASWLVTHSARANEAGVKLSACVELVRTLKNHLDMLTGDAAA